MKRTLVYGTATALVALSMGGCAQATTSENVSEAPVSQDDATGKTEADGQTDKDDIDEEPESDLYGPPVVDVEDDGWDDSIAEPVYGPPPVDDGEDADANGIRFEHVPIDETSVS